MTEIVAPKVVEAAVEVGEEEEVAWILGTEGEAAPAAVDAGHFVPVDVAHIVPPPPPPPPVAIILNPA